jgi:pheromone shutdown protein TraB
MAKKKKKRKGKSKGVKVSIHIEGAGNVVGDRNRVSVASPSSVVVGATAAEFTALLARLREGLLAAKLDEKARKAVESDIGAIQAEAKDANPSLPVVEGKLKSVESIVTRAIGIGSTLAPVVQKLLELGHQLFK